MKRLFTFLFALVVAVTFTSAVKADDDYSGSAENNTYTGSAEYTGIIASAVTATGDRIISFYLDEVTFTQEDLDEMANNVDKLLVVQSTTEKTASDVTKAASTLGIDVDGYTANFYDIIASSNVDSATIILSNVPLVTSTSKVKVIHWKSSDGQPEELPATVNSDGSVTFTMTSFSPVAVLVNNNTPAATTPAETPSTKTPTKKASEKTCVR